MNTDHFDVFTSDTCLGEKKKSDHRIWKETGGDVYGTKNCY